jgi:hypothetical protein
MPNSMRAGDLAAGSGGILAPGSGPAKAPAEKFAPHQRLNGLGFFLGAGNLAPPRGLI